MKINKFLAIDLGATSGRTIIGTLGNGNLEQVELTRFPNPIIETNGHYYWDIYALYNEIIKALKIVAQDKIEITSIGIDTWGVDFGFVAKDGELLRQPYSYRDAHTVGAPEAFFKSVPKEKVYELTGIQIMNFNSLYQLDAIRRAESSVWSIIHKIIFIPDLLAYMLTGNVVTEYTIASTSQILNPRTKQLDTELLEALGLRPEQFGPIVYHGTTIGHLTEDVRRQTGLGDIPVVAVAGHDTGAAVAAVPAEGKQFAYLSSGTWSLMGIEVDEPIINEKSYELNFTNEGGVDGTIRFLKNICGMWLLESCRKEWELAGRDWSYPELIEKSKQAEPFASLINPDAPVFANPVSMTGAIRHYCKATDQKIPQSEGEFTRCIFDSLALRYKQVFGFLQGFSSAPLQCLHVIGGGSQNVLLNQFTANALGVEVVAGPAEATAIGNIFLQARAAGLVDSLSEMRSLIKKSISLYSFSPNDEETWNKAYDNYLKVYKEIV
jgi:rhamnulokinase